MSFFSKLFAKKKEEPVPDNSLPWIEAASNKWEKRLLDLRPVTHTMLSTSKDPQMATNAVSYGNENGTSFWGIKPATNRTIPCDLSFIIDKTLEPGVIFIPKQMEHKWAIYYDGTSLIFVRSWLRQVVVVASTRQDRERLFIESITGEFTPNESASLTKAILNFILISHGIEEVVPAPLPFEMENELRKAAMWAFSIYGNQAAVGVFDESFLSTPENPLRSHSLLHVAVAMGDIKGIEQYVAKGFKFDYLAGDGLAPLHWSLAQTSTNTTKALLDMGADPDVRSAEGATPIMNAVQSNKLELVSLLIDAGADVNARDNRGFTALHRAAEMGHLEIVKLLLSKSADKTIDAEGHTALSLALASENKEIADLLR